MKSPCPNGTHAGGLVSSVGLRAVLEVGVGTAGAVDTDVPGGGDVGATVRLRHDGDDGDTRRRAHGLGAQPRQQRSAVGLGHGGDHLHQLGRPRQTVSPACGGLERVEVHILPAPRELPHRRDDLGDGPHPGLLLREPRREGDAPAPRSRLPAARLLRCRHGGGGGGCHRERKGFREGFGLGSGTSWVVRRVGVGLGRVGVPLGPWIGSKALGSVQPPDHR